MKFQLTKTLQKINTLYKRPKTKERFHKYLYLLQGDNKNEMLLPIAGFNPMGKELAANKLEQLIALKAEEIAEEELLKINKTLPIKEDRIIQVGLNLADDVEGAWSNYYTTDYSSKFEIGALLKRNFCTPYFWTSETLTEEMIRQRVRAYAYRTIFWLTNGQPKILEELLAQEIYVEKNVNNYTAIVEEQNFAEIEKIYQAHAESSEYNLIFNFFYGDKASELLAYPLYGVKQKDGFQYAKYLAAKRSELKNKPIPNTTYHKR